MRNTEKSLMLALLAGLMCLALGAAAFAAEPFTLERTIALKSVSGRIDHMAIDLGRQRLFVAELGNGTVDVIDLRTETPARRIEGLREPQGVSYAPGADVLAVASAGDGSVRLFRGADLAPAGRIELGDDADNIRTDARSGDFVVGYGSGDLAVIDPAKGAVVGRITLPAHPEGFQLDAEGRRAFVNLPDARQVAVVDLNAGRQTATWPTQDLRGNFPMAFDAERGMVAVAFRSPTKLVTFDINSGKPAGTLAICGDADDVFLDARRHRFYVSCGGGGVDVWQQDASSYRHLSFFHTASGARTSLFVPELDVLFVAAPAGLFGLGHDAAILVLRPGG